MQIDWLTVTAQIANFLVLAWLLYRFLYGPITRAMERREQRIAQRLNDAEKKREEAETEAETLRMQRAELEQQRAQILAKAEADAAEERRRLHDAARDAVEEQKRAWIAELEQQRSEFLHDIRQRAQSHFYSLARKVLSDLADAPLEAQIARAFLTRLAASDTDTRQRLADAGQKAHNAATVRSGFDMPADLQHDITNFVQANILAQATVTFVHDPDTVCGVVLKMGGQSLTWNVAGYFDSLEKLIEQDLGDRSPFAEGTGNG